MADSSAKTVKGSTNFVWFTAHSLGRGAMGNVYVGRNRRKGDKYAVKVFNQEIRMMTKDYIAIELKILQAVPKHDNIVRVVAVEEETYSKDKVVIMELCDGGSLQQILDEPENYFGLQEDEFLLVLFHIGAALRHLYQHRIVHRDIKPGNILLCILADDSHVYKLTDFGAGTTTSEEESGFKSLSGTEEYLHPDMHRAAFVARVRDVTYDATVDLWSFGITIYQCATGCMAFEPNSGIRVNKRKMQQLMRDKDSGVISQVEGSDGVITKRRELPETCYLSSGTRRKTEDLLRILFDLEKRPTPDVFFSELHQIRQQVKCHVFLLESPSLITVYVNRNNTLMHLREEIAKQTEIPAGAQTLLFRDGLIENNIADSGTAKISQYPETSRDNPIMLTTDAQLSPRIMTFSSGSLPSLPANVSDPDMYSDAKWAKWTCGTVVFISFVLSSCIINQNHMVNMRNILRNLLSQLCKVLQPYVDKHQSIVCVYVTMYERVGQISKAKTSKALNNIADFVKNCKITQHKLHARYSELQEQIKALDMFTGQHCNVQCVTDRCLQKGLKMVKEAITIYQKLYADRKKTLCHNEMEIHKYHKSELRRACRRIRELVCMHCLKGSAHLFDGIGNQMRTMKELWERLHILEQDITEFDQINLKQLEYEMNKLAASKDESVDIADTAPSELYVGSPDVKDYHDEYIKSHPSIKVQYSSQSSDKSSCDDLPYIDIPSTSSGHVPSDQFIYGEANTRDPPEGARDSTIDSAYDTPSIYRSRAVGQVGTVYNCDPSEPNNVFQSDNNYMARSIAGGAIPKQYTHPTVRHSEDCFDGYMTASSNSYKSNTQIASEKHHIRVRQDVDGASIPQHQNIPIKAVRSADAVSETLKTIRRNVNAMDIELRDNSEILNRLLEANMKLTLPE